MKPWKWRSKLLFLCAISTGYLHQFDLNICHEKGVEDNLRISDAIV